MPTVLPYHEPSLIHLLVFSSFLYLLNIIRIAADFLVHGGIVAEITLGIIYGSPLAGLLSVDWEATFTVLGYMGLILVVFEGGLSSNLPMLFSNLPLSIVCAVTGIILPVALSFASLYAGFGYRPLEAFAAGAALSSDSLGTTLAALNSAAKSASPSSAGASLKQTQSSPSTRNSVADRSLPVSRTPSHLPAHRVDTSATLTAPTSAVSPNSLKQSRVGTVLISAAIIDDVVGLIIAGVMPALAVVQSETEEGGGSSIAWPIVRPLLASVLIAFVTPVVARFVLRPLFWWGGFGERWCAPARPGKPWGLRRLADGWGTENHADAAKLFLMVATLSAMAAISHYAGSSVLFGAYIAGLVLTYVSQPPEPSTPDNAFYDAGAEKHSHVQRTQDLAFEETFARTLGPVQEYVLLPLFFASIGFAIPFLDLWRPTVIWRGIVYSILMCLAKLAVGVPILLYGPYLEYGPSFRQAMKSGVVSAFSAIGSTLPSPLRPRKSADASPEEPPGVAEETQTKGKTNEVRFSHAQTPDPERGEPERESPVPAAQPELSPYSIRASIPAASFIGAAMVARGEIGLLIAQLARGGSEDTPGSEAGVLSEEPFLLCIWAIFLCTLVGPMALGFAVRKWGPLVNSGIWA
ncbi:hypothetical protein BD413DRAFT_595561 [Trametes elegans]|nr:hypothetical protein BD413DRAFT_595561 [Trametes elegans]